MHKPLVFCLLFFGWTQAAWLQELGSAPALGTSPRDLGVSFKLPPLHDQPGNDPEKQLRDLQVGKRARALKLDGQSAYTAWLAADATLQAARARASSSPPAEVRVFTGERASELNALLRDPAIQAVNVASARLEVDEPVRLQREKFWLDLGNTELRATQAGLRFLLRVERASGTVVKGGAFVGGDWGALVDGGRDVTLVGGRYAGLRGGGVLLHDAAGAVLARSTFTRNGEAAVLVHGDTVGATLLDNEIVGNLGSSNWHAGVVVSDRNGAVTDDPRDILNPDRYGVREQPMPARLHPPRHNVFAFNRIALNASSGVYSDGGVESVIFGNTVEGNAKEGVCLEDRKSVV